MKKYKVTFLDNFNSSRKNVVFIEALSDKDAVEIFFEKYGGFLLYTEFVDYVSV